MSIIITVVVGGEAPKILKLILLRAPKRLGLVNQKWVRPAAWPVFKSRPEMLHNTLYNTLHYPVPSQSFITYTSENVEILHHTAGQYDDSSMLSFLYMYMYFTDFKIAIYKCVTLASSSESKVNFGRLFQILKIAELDPGLLISI